MPVTLRDIAKKVNLSHATVSFVLNNRLDVSIPAATRQRVLDAAKELGYRPNQAARALAKGKTHMIALWIPSTQNAFYASVLHHLQGVMRDSEYEAIVCQARFGASDGARRNSLSWPVDGVIAVDCGYFADELVEMDGFRGVPTVHVGTYVSEDQDYVAVDLYDGAKQAMQHLLSLGRKRIAFVGFRNPADSEDPRLRAYMDAMKEAGQMTEVLVCPEARRASIRDFVKARLQEKDRPDALFCYNDSTAISANRGVTEAGLRCPEDVAIVGCDGTEETEYTTPPLTTIAQPVADMCETSWSFLMKRLNDAELPHQSLVLRPNLLIRQSTAG